MASAPLQVEPGVTNTRKHPRYRTTLFAPSGDNSGMVECRGNVSAGGFCIETDCLAKPGETIDILFRLPGAGFWLRATGVVLGCEDMPDTKQVRGKFQGVDIGDGGSVLTWLQNFFHPEN
jgi:hypothetical protein